MKHYSGLYFILICLLFSCHPLELENEQHVRQTPIQCRTKSPALGDFVNNPYEIHNMQHANDSLCNLFNEPTIELDPTDVYVRFLPKDSVEYRTMLSLGTEFFDMPLTFEPYDPICSYRDPSVPDTLITWQYTMVPYGTTLPNIEYEVIDTCCIPFNLRSSPIEGYEVMLDKLANMMANPGAEYLDDSYDHRITTNPTRSFPSGRAMVRTAKGIVPLRHIKIRVKHITNYGYAYTDDDGYYIVPKRFNYDPQYEIVFDNNLGFSEYFIDKSPSRFWKYLMHHSRSGYDILIDTTDVSWLASYVNNVIVDYYDSCAVENRQLPPSDLRVLVENGNTLLGSGAPMLRQISHNSLVGYTIYELIQGLLVGDFNLVPACVYGVLKYVIPDVVIQYDSILMHSQRDTVIYLNTFHELSHASHYARAGFPVWSGVIAHTIRCSVPVDIGYGDGTINDAAQDACELAEAWALTNQRKKWEELKMAGPRYVGDSSWLNPSINGIYNLIYKYKYLTGAQVLDNMTSNVQSVNDLCTSLKNTYPTKRIRINNVFAEAHALTNQTLWRVNNKTGQTLIFSIRKGNTIVHSRIASDSTFVMTSIPSTMLGFYATWDPTYSDYNPNEFFIRRQSDVSMVYHQVGNGIVKTAMNRPFFVENQWTVIDSTIVGGNKRKLEFIYDLTSSDIQ